MLCGGCVLYFGGFCLLCGGFCGGCVLFCGGFSVSCDVLCGVVWCFLVLYGEILSCRLAK